MPCCLRPCFFPLFFDSAVFNSCCFNSCKYLPAGQSFLAKIAGSAAPNPPRSSAERLPTGRAATARYVLAQSARPSPAPFRCFDTAGMLIANGSANCVDRSLAGNQPSQNRAPRRIGQRRKRSAKWIQTHIVFNYWLNTPETHSCQAPSGRSRVKGGIRVFPFLFRDRLLLASAGEAVRSSLFFLSCTLVQLSLHCPAILFPIEKKYRTLNPPNSVANRPFLGRITEDRVRKCTPGTTKDRRVFRKFLERALFCSFLLFGIGLFGPRSAHAQVSPGPLSKAHSSLDVPPSASRATPSAPSLPLSNASIATRKWPKISPPSTAIIFKSRCAIPTAKTA